MSFPLPTLPAHYTWRFAGGHFTQMHDPFDPDDGTPDRNGNGYARVGAEHSALFERVVYEAVPGSKAVSLWCVEFADHNRVCHFFVDSWPDLIQLLALLAQAMGPFTTD